MEVESDGVETLEDDSWADGPARPAKRQAVAAAAPAVPAPAEAEERAELIASIRLTFPLIAGAADVFAEDKPSAWPVELLRYWATCTR